MTHNVRLCLVLHNHQPVGNFDGVIEQAYQDSYLPFLDVFEGYDALRISLHTSGPLMTLVGRETSRIRASRGSFWWPLSALKLLAVRSTNPSCRCCQVAIA